ncbi:MAG: cytochrome b/b6 domain-containing protein [Magnetococcales bacterium]|nr:cytochrome b/b6 domain-containing protein [Magnetococcales bacterium]
MTWRQRLVRYFRTCVNAESEVWDRPTRFFHWSITGLVVLALLTGWFDPAWQIDRHLMVGAMVTGLWMFRMLWGWVGGEYSRFSHYLHAPGVILADAAALWRGRLKLASLGLNPLNALVSLLLLLILGGLILTGLATYGGEEHLGPLATVVSYRMGQLAQEWHGHLSWTLIALALLHVLIIRRESSLTRISLMRSMITGCKPMDADQTDENARTANFSWAMIIGVVCIFAIDHASKTMQQIPMDGWRPLNYPRAYQEKCGQCHWTIHPSLLPEESWQPLLHNLEHHFGQRVTLSGKEAITIASFLLVHAAEDWNTDAAHRFRRVTPDPGQRLTEHPVWEKLHGKVDPTLFTTPPVSSRLNCPVCHHDALSGRFDKHAIHLPKPAAALPP